jgi:serine/threonine protein kinase
MIKLNQEEEALFEAARRLNSATARKAFLDQACAGNSDSQERIQGMLLAEAEAEKFFADVSSLSRQPLKLGATPIPPSNGNGSPDESKLTEGPGTRIGHYKLLQRIGEGGGGVVYMAEQEEPVRRRIALKIIKLGMDTKNVIARFEAERQALAMMDHPNIARVLDAGATDTGRPFFVMELVRGMKITEYCDQNKLDTIQRLKLFVQICQAIQHAHQKGIIHRDIKPSNILVTLHDGVPVPKVIDFGIAKATEVRLTDKTLFTAYEQFIGTPAYMSPEQAEMSGLDVDTRSDIYSLGVLLYELLTGRTPFDPTKLLEFGLDELRRTLREREPQRPSTILTTLQGDELTRTARSRQAEPPKLISSLRGDLDWIVMKALEKDRSRRYETANGFAMDIQRHLNNEPVIARPPSRLYRFQKLVRRNKVVFAAASIVTLALIGSLAVSTRLFLMERKARANEAKLRQQAEAREKITQAAVLLSQEEFAEADGIISRLPLAPPTLEGAAVFRSLGEWHAVQNRLDKAVQRFAVLLQVNQFDGWDLSTLDYLECGTALIELRDRDGYNRFREAAIARFAKTASPVAAERIVKISLLLPADDKTMTALAPLAGFAARSFSGNGENVDNDGNPANDAFRRAWAAVSVALMKYRQGDFVQAEQWCHRCLACPEYNAVRSATARILLAMCYQQLHRPADARSQLTEGGGVIEEKFKNGIDRGNRDPGFWFDWFFARILLREANALIDKSTAPAV